MRKTIALILCLGMLFALMAGCSGSRIEPYDTDDEAAADAADADAGDASTEADAEAEGEDDAPVINIGKGGTGAETYDPDTVVATVNGSEVTWREYYYWLNYYVMYVQQVAGQYGASLTSWDANELSRTDTNAEVVLMNAHQNIIQQHAVITQAEVMGVTLSEEDEAEISAVFETNADSVAGDGDGECTEEEAAAFEEYLGEQFVDRALFDALNTAGLLSNKEFEAIYGEQGADMPDEDVLAYAADNNLMSAKHILLLTVDAETREPITDEDALAEKKATAEDIYAQLKAVEGDKEALVALFDQLMAQYTEDTGYEHYPDGYVFGEGEMVTEFEDAVKALEGDYALSDIVESSYGYHIIMSIPMDPNAVVGTNSSGEDVTLRYQAASSQFSSQISTWTDEAEVVWGEGFENLNLAAVFG